jgi:hypothetical protein
MFGRKNSDSVFAWALPMVFIHGPLSTPRPPTAIPAAHNQSIKEIVFGEGRVIPDIPTL